MTIRRPSKQGLQVKIDSVRMWSLSNLSNWTDYESHVTFESRPLPPLRLHRLFPSRRTNGSQLPSRFFSPTHPFPHSPFFPGYTICFATQHQPSAFTNTYLILVWGILPLFAPATLLWWTRPPVGSHLSPCMSWESVSSRKGSSGSFSPTASLLLHLRLSIIADWHYFWFDKD